jgi:homoserine kinase
MSAHEPPDPSEPLAVAPGHDRVPDRVRDRVRVFAPATIANLGPGFDVLGVAVDGLGDVVAAERVDGPPGVELAGILGDGGRLPRDVEANTAAVAAASVARRLGLRARLHLEKGLPLCSGLGSSAASAVAGAAALAALAGVDLAAHRKVLLPDVLDGEAVASGARHADNAGPSLLGGVVLICGPHADPPELVELPVPTTLWLALGMPDLELPTREARAALPASIALSTAVTAWARLSGMVAAFYRDDLELLARCLVDEIVEPVRGRLIRGFDAVKAAAADAGALACSISGAGPTVFALADSEAAARAAGAAMVAAWLSEGVAARAHVGRPDLRGARLLE